MLPTTMFNSIDMWSDLYIEWANEHDRPISSISHYTKRDRFFAIVDSRQLRATNVWDIPDQDEITEGRRLIRQAIDRGISKATGIAHKFLESLCDESLRNLTSGQNAYIACFCVDSDDADMWQTSFSDHGHGWELTFNTGGQIRSYLAMTSGVVGRSVEYDCRKHRLWLDRYVDALIRSSGPSTPEEDISMAQNFFLKSLIECLTCFKPQKYLGEKEYRLIYWNPPPDNVILGENDCRYVYLPISSRSSRSSRLGWDHHKDCLIELFQIIKGPRADKPTDPELRMLRDVFPGRNQTLPFRPSRW